jgi:mRNA interferase HigB
LLDVRKVYRHADPVKVASGRTVTVFNVCGNRYRMAVAFHYDKKRVFVLWLGTHAEYSKDAWKETL